MEGTIEQIQAMVRSHRDGFVDATLEQVREQMPQTLASIGEERLRRDLGDVIDAVIEMSGTDDPKPLYQNQLRIAADRIARGMTLPQYLEIALLGFPVMRRFADEHGLPFATMERVLMRLVVIAGDAYSRAYSEHVARLERQRHQAEAETKRIRALSELVTGVAHEINTPLGIIIQASTMVAEELEPEDIHSIARDDNAKQVLRDMAEALVLIEKNVGRVDSLVKSFKSLSIHQNTDDVNEQDLAKICEEAITMFRSRDSASRIKVTFFDHRAEPGRKWMGHGTYLVNILVEFLTNVERYAYEDGSGPATIELFDREEGVRIVVTDIGQGIEPDRLDKVFNPFFTTGRHLGASGLGLTIVYNLVTEAMNGTVGIEPADPGVRAVLDVPMTL